MENVKKNMGGPEIKKSFCFTNKIQNLILQYFTYIYLNRVTFTP